MEYSIQDIIEYIVQDFGLEYDHAMQIFYNSQTFDKLMDIETGLYRESSAYVYGIFQGELNSDRNIIWIILESGSLEYVRKEDLMVLENKLGINNSAELARMEEKISKKRAAALFESSYLDDYEAGAFQMLAAIHKYLFEQIYDFAGKVRTVNIAKGNFRFASVLYLQSALVNIEKMPQSTFDEIIEKYVEMNIAHPFREGNGRSTRIWLDFILKKELNLVIDWSMVDKDDYLSAMERSPIKDIEIKHILKQALTDKIDDRKIYMKGIDYSYYYEGYAVYNAEDL